MVGSAPYQTVTFQLNLEPLIVLSEPPFTRMLFDEGNPIESEAKFDVGVEVIDGRGVPAGLAGALPDPAAGTDGARPVA